MRNSNIKKRMDLENTIITYQEIERCFCFDLKLRIERYIQVLEKDCELLFPNYNLKTFYVLVSAVIDRGQ